MQHRTRSDRQTGQAVLEFAIVLPLILLLLMGIYDFACALRANNSISNMSREGANLASRPSAGMQDRRQDIMNALSATAQPLNMRENGMMFITVIQGDTIRSQEGWENSRLKDSVASRIGTPTPSQPNPKVHAIASLALAPTQSAFVVEVFYNYRSLFSSNALLLGQQLYSRTVF